MQSFDKGWGAKERPLAVFNPVLHIPNPLPSPPACFGLSNKGIEDAIFDSQAIRRFVGIDLSRETSPNATTLLKWC